MLRLAVDLRPLLEPFESGVTQYTKALVREFLKRPEEVQLDLFYQARNRCERIHRLFPSVRHVPISNTRFHLRCLLGFPRLPLAYFKQRPDLIWLPDRRPFYRTEIPLVMTVHDKVPERFPRTLSVKSRLWHLIFPLNRLLALCGGVLVPTLTIRSQIRTKLPVEVTYEGVQLEPPETPEIAQALKKVPFFLSISPSDPRKRLDWFLAMADRFPKANFVVIGLKRGDARFARQKVKTRPNLHLLGEVTEAEKTWFLRHARALVAISMYEGFDLPVLEAVAAKCPVILSDIDVHHELYKDACFIRSKEDLEGVIYRALHSKIPVPHVRGDYSWTKAAERSLLFFLRVLLHKNGDRGRDRDSHDHPNDA